jgi:hypothetical protein
MRATPPNFVPHAASAKMARNVCVAIDQIGYIGPSDPQLHPGPASRLLVYGVEITVRETPKDVVRLLESNFNR